jgi:hypothetical protein
MRRDFICQIAITTMLPGLLTGNAYATLDDEVGEYGNEN